LNSLTILPSDPPMKFGRSSKSEINRTITKSWNDLRGLRIGRGMTEVPFFRGLAEAGTEAGSSAFPDPFGFKSALINRFGGFVEFLGGNIEEFGQVDFLSLRTDQVAVENQLGGIALLVDPGFHFPVHGTFGDEAVDLERFDAVEAVGAIFALEDFVKRRRIAVLDDVGAERKAVAFGHAFAARELDGKTALLKAGGGCAALGLVQTAVENFVRDTSLLEAAGDFIERIVEE